MNITLLGATFSTGNLGVSALAGSSIHLLTRQWPDCKISIIGGRKFSKHKEYINGSATEINCYPLRYSVNIFNKNHILGIYALVILSKLFPVMKRFISSENTANQILESDMTCDITGGDSFSDIYGMKRLLMGYLIKRICQISGKPFVMLPQTYGPFKFNMSKKLARKILLQTDKIYSRDKESLGTIENLIGKTNKTTVCPDVAFSLEPASREKIIQKFDNAKILIEKINEIRARKCQLIGFNISGLLYNGGYTGNNELGIQEDYKKSVNEIINYFLSQDETSVMLVPHVVPGSVGLENDLVACRRIWNNLPENFQNRTIIVETDNDQLFFDQNEIKYLIGLCDFFLGSRMHATIAAISQCIPTVGLAYSKKFAGVYETVGIEDCVVDLRKHNTEKILGLIEIIFNRKDIVKENLERKIPKVKEQVYSIFNGVKC